MRAKKGSHRIVVGGTGYRWQAKGNDGFIEVVIWPTNGVGPDIHGMFEYHETLIPSPAAGGCASSGDQIIIITNRIIRRIIEHALAKHNYHPGKKGKQLNLRSLDDVIEWKDAVRRYQVPWYDRR
ncbi:MAG: hypothetical protein ACHRHE_21445 [Tepidisphaerales bacterium]